MPIIKFNKSFPQIAPSNSTQNALHTLQILGHMNVRLYYVRASKLKFRMNEYFTDIVEWHNDESFLKF